MQADRPTLHVLFTLDCPAVGPKAPPYGPLGWDRGSRTIDAFCAALLGAGYPPTLFLSPEAADQHGPMCEDLIAAGAEIGLLVEPPALRGAGFKRLLGAYDAEKQRTIVGESSRRFADSLGYRPQSVRSAYYSANDATFGVLDALGFRQASTSSPGRRIPKHVADWHGAPADAHFVSPSSRLVAGDLALLEVPVTTDARQRRGGVAPDLVIENGTLDRWHAPLIEGQLVRQDAERVAFRTLCCATSSGVTYYDPETRPRRTLDGLIEHVNELEGRYEIVPATLSGAYAHYRAASESAALTKEVSLR